jgi:hypothetical protein
MRAKLESGVSYFGATRDIYIYIHIYCGRATIGTEVDESTKAT